MERSNSAEAPLAIGEVAARSGIAASALRFYEAEGLIQAERDAAGRRWYPRAVLRLVAFIRTAQRLGISLAEVRAALGELPDGRTPNRADWTRLSRRWRPVLDRRIQELMLLRDKLDGCIGCGCLSLRRCRLYNPDDQMAADGPGPRHLLAGDVR